MRARGRQRPLPFLTGSEGEQCPTVLDCRDGSVSLRHEQVQWRVTVSNIDASDSRTRVLDRVRDELEDRQVFASTQTRRRVLLHAFVLVVAFVALTVAVQRYVPVLTDTQALAEYIRGYGILAPLVLIALQAVQVVAAPIPGQLLAVVAGYVFGAWWGTLYNMIGVTIGSTVAFWLSRRYGRSYVETVIADDALDQFDAVSDSYGRPALFLVFLVPGLPDDVICFAGGLTDIPLWQLVVIAIVGRAPAFFLVNVVGELFSTNDVPAAIALSVVLVVISGLAYLYRDHLLDRFRDSSP
jgi:uncharacterized membrane protein YdjX (TVP38/TMEM64 family)